MIPKSNTESSYEKVKDDVWLTGVIEEVQFEKDHKFKGQFPRTADAVRFKFVLDGYKQPHYSNWLTFSYDERSRLFKDFLVKLVDGAVPWMEFDTDQLTGKPVKTMWTTAPGKNGQTYQNVDRVMSYGPKSVYNAPKVEPQPEAPQDPLDEAPLEEE